ncbi:hypothetical protein PHET_00956 [Paragonimus heterotremus]|uniref:Uncharacterized protein n=1 Tax=Paragonimus heterotremus TaxID=100268 RepID=A0A8J4WUY0_9TREM|nr:hypothetical protein PHET_00956 [Paragonimus heterotremus]
MNEVQRASLHRYGEDWTLTFDVIFTVPSYFSTDGHRPLISLRLTFRNQSIFLSFVYVRCAAFSEGIFFNPLFRLPGCLNFLTVFATTRVFK